MKVRARVIVIVNTQPGAAWVEEKGGEERRERTEGSSGLKGKGKGASEGGRTSESEGGSRREAREGGRRERGAGESEAKVVELER